MSLAYLQEFSEVGTDMSGSNVPHHETIARTPSGRTGSIFEHGNELGKMKDVKD